LQSHQPPHHWVQQKRPAQMASRPEFTRTPGTAARPNSWGAAQPAPSLQAPSAVLTPQVGAGSTVVNAQKFSDHVVENTTRLQSPALAPAASPLCMGGQFPTLLSQEGCDGLGGVALCVHNTSFELGWC